METPSDRAMAETPSWDQLWPPISYWVKAAVAVVGVIIAFRLLGILESVLLVMAVSLVLAIGLQPAISWLENRGLHRGLAILALIITLLVVVAGLGFVLVPTIATQLGNLVNALPAYLDELESGGGWLAGLLDRFDLIERVQGAGDALAGTAIGLLRSVGNAAFHTVIVFVLTPSFAYTLPSIKRWAVRLLGRERREDFLFVLDRSTDMIAHYMLGNLVVGFVAGVTAFIFLSILGVPYALALAAFVAVTDLIPAVGATIGALAAVAVAAFTGIPQLIGTLIFMVVYQQLENHVVIPRVMKRVIDLSPAVVIVSLLIGAKVAGLVGILLALPLAAMIKVVIVEFVVADRIETVRSADAADAIKGPRRFKRRAEKLGQRPLP